MPLISMPVMGSPVTGVSTARAGSTGRRGVVREGSRARPASPQRTERHEPFLHLAEPARPGEVEGGESFGGLQVEEVAVGRVRAVHRPSHHELRRPQRAPRARRVKQGVAAFVRGARHHPPLQRILQFRHVVASRGCVRLGERDVVAAEGFVGGGGALATAVTLTTLAALGPARLGERAGAEVAPVPGRRRHPTHCAN